MYSAYETYVVQINKAYIQMVKLFGNLTDGKFNN